MEEDNTVEGMVPEISVDKESLHCVTKGWIRLFSPEDGEETNQR
jgi:hypothetical protein